MFAHFLDNRLTYPHIHQCRSRTYAANLLEQVKREQATSQTLREQLDATYVDLKKVVEEKRKLFTRMSKYSLQQEEKDSFLGHQRGVDEQNILEASRTLETSPLRLRAAEAAAVRATEVNHRGREREREHRPEFDLPDDTRAPTRSTSVSGPRSDYLTGTGSVDVSSAPPVVPRPVSPYLREQATNATSARTSTESVPLTHVHSASHLKAELTQLDGEIGMLPLFH